MGDWLAHPNAGQRRRALGALTSALWRVHGRAFLLLGVLKLLVCVASFGGPLLLGAMVSERVSERVGSCKSE